MKAVGIEPSKSLWFEELTPSSAPISLGEVSMVGIISGSYIIELCGASHIRDRGTFLGVSIIITIIVFGGLIGVPPFWKKNDYIASCRDACPLF